MNRLIFILALSFLFTGNLCAQRKSNDVFRGVTQRERAAYLGEAKHFIEENFYSTILEAVADIAVHENIIPMLMAEEAEPK